MKQQTAVEWYYEQIVIQGKTNYFELLEQAKEMEKQQIIDAFGVGCHHESKRLVGYQDVAEQYYNETYGSKGSENNPCKEIPMDDYYEQVERYREQLRKGSDEIKKAEEMGLYDKIELANPNDNIFTSSQKEFMTIERIKEIQSKTAYPNSASVQQALLQVWNECVTSSQTEISDEEIVNEAIEHSNLYTNKFTPRNAFIMGAKWYREQLRKISANQ